MKKEEYNGLLGEITDEFDVKKCRWTIILEANGKKIRLPPNQLKIAPEDDLASIVNTIKNNCFLLWFTDKISKNL